jgi:hypothetical protein
MPDRASQEDKDRNPAAKNAWIVQIAVPIISVIGTIVAAYFGYVGVVAPLRLSLQATQTAEARHTLSAASTPTPSQTSTATPSATATGTPNPPEPTFTPTIPPSGVKYCVDIAALNVRNGPGMEYDIIGAVRQDDCLFFDGQYLFGETNYWVRISPNQGDYLLLAAGWVYGGALRPQDFERLPPVTPPPVPYHSPTPGF